MKEPSKVSASNSGHEPYESPYEQAEKDRLSESRRLLCAPLEALPEAGSLFAEIAASRGPLAVHELSDSQKAHFCSAIEYSAGRRVVYITQNEYTAQRAYEDFAALYGLGALFFPAREIMLYDVEAKEYDIVFRRVKALDRFLSGDYAVAVMSVEAAAQFIPPPGLFKQMTKRFEAGGRVDLREVSAGLVEMGYERVASVEARGAFAIRGGVLDVYPVDSEYAVRIELFDDEVDSIRLFDAQTQRTVGPAAGGSVRILPARDILYGKDDLADITGRIRAACKARRASDGAAGKSGAGGAHGAGGVSGISGANSILNTVDEDIAKFENSHYFAGIDRYLAFICKEGCTPLDYTRDCVYVIDEPVRAFQKLQGSGEEHGVICVSLIEKGKLLPEAARVQQDFQGLLKAIPPRQRVTLSAIRTARETELVGPQKSRAIQGKPAISYQGNVELLKTDVRERIRDKWTVVLLTKSAVKAERLMESLRAEQIPVSRLGHMAAAGLAGGSAAPGTAAPGGSAAPGTAAPGGSAAPGTAAPGGSAATGAGAGVGAAGSAGSPALPVPGLVNICYGALASGFEYPKIKLIVICDSEFQGGSRVARRQKKPNQGAKINFFTDLKTGDFVVHQAHGIGVFAGLEQLKTGDAVRDYLKIRYKDGDLLYIPTNQLDLVQKYVGSDARAPKVNSLNSTEWAKTKNRVKESLRTLAAELILIYAKRREARGFAFSEDTVWQRQFEEQFPYAETEDQLRSIEEIKADMESPRLMDRLLCGDVGFGKTEVAIRAAFKAVTDGKQVAFLVPTTVLAQQHYQTFTERFRDFPVSVDVLSRFKTAKEQKQIESSLNDGKLDIVIGTHKLLNRGIRFKNLGLLVVDEEQRFGVNQKERIKAVKPDVDVLSLSATPIPRTLHMSMTKIRDISVLKDPPEERFPVQTFVMEYDEDVVREAILREIARGGQVFYLYNRVMGIDIKTMRLRAMLPDTVRMAYAHGQMGNRELEDIMLAFINRQYDVLICTTIIESGLDIPNVNTIVVEDADHMGLAQLYQLRGRVGRSNRLAYAYITHRRDKVISDESEKRLAAIREFTELGSGFKIAMRDMEIRGVGNLLGVEQHGHMESVGYDMYCRLLDEAVREIEREKGGSGAAAMAAAKKAGAGGGSAAMAADRKAGAGGGSAAMAADRKAGAGGGAPVSAAARKAGAGGGVAVAASFAPAAASAVPASSASAAPKAKVGAGAKPGAQEDSGIDHVAQVSLDLHVDAYIDSLYIDDESLRLEMYQKIAAVRSEEDAQDVADEMIDRFSDMPPEAVNLIKLAVVKVLAASCGISSVAEKGGVVMMTVSDSGSFNIKKLPALLAKYKQQIMFSAGAAPYISFKPTGANRPAGAQPIAGAKPPVSAQPIAGAKPPVSAQPIVSAKSPVSAQPIVSAKPPVSAQPPAQEYPAAAKKAITQTRLEYLASPQAPLRPQEGGDVPAWQRNRRTLPQAAAIRAEFSKPEDPQRPPQPLPQSARAEPPRLGFPQRAVMPATPRVAKPKPPPDSSLTSEEVLDEVLRLLRDMDGNTAV